MTYQCSLFIILVLLLQMIQARRIGHGSRNRIRGHNAILKDKPVPNVDPDTYEAYYYQSYDGSNDVFRGYDARPGQATTEQSCNYIRDVTKELRMHENMEPFGVQHFYQKYTETYGIPVLGSASVSDAAMARACYVLRFLLAGRQDLRDAFYSNHGRVSVIARDEELTDLPEYSFLDPAYDLATRGLGGIPAVPVSSAGEENVLCEERDRYLSEDILLREIAVGILHIASRTGMPDLQQEIQESYLHAIRSSWWRNTYASLTSDAYFGEGVQSFFRGNGFSQIPDGRHNHVSIRTRLRSYDTNLYNIIQKIFPCVNRYIGRCNSRGHEHHQQLSMDCNIPLWGRERSSHKRRRHLKANYK